MTTQAATGSTRAYLRSLLADGEWHRLPSIVTAAMPHYRVETLVRCARTVIAHPENFSQEELIWRGAFRYTRTYLNQIGVEKRWVDGEAEVRLPPEGHTPREGRWHPWGERMACARGHVYTEESTRWRMDRATPTRECRECARERDARRPSRWKKVG